MAIAKRFAAAMSGIAYDTSEHRVLSCVRGTPTLLPRQESREVRRSHVRVLHEREVAEPEGPREGEAPRRRARECTAERSRRVSERRLPRDRRKPRAVAEGVDGLAVRADAEHRQRRDDEVRASENVVLPQIDYVMGSASSCFARSSSRTPSTQSRRSSRSRATPQARRSRCARSRVRATASSYRRRP